MTRRTIRRLRSLAIATLSACFSGVVGLAAAAEPPATPPAGTFTGSAAVAVVEVPVQVVRGGQPVRGLTAADFTVWAGKQRQQIVGFETLDVDALQAAGASAVNRLPASARRHF